MTEEEAGPEKRCVLILGGARSGKSRFAQQLATGLGDRVLFVATAEARDEEMGRRIDSHRESRPPAWRTLEAPLDVGRRILEQVGDAQVVVLDCLTLLASNVIGDCTTEAHLEAVDPQMLEQRLDAELDELMRAVDAIDASCVIVSNEVGLGLVPANRLGRLYRDLLGKVNRALAERADDVYFMAAGLPLQLKPR